MKARPVKNKKTGEIVSYQLRAYVGKDLNGKSKFATKVWKPDRQYTEKQLEKEVVRQQMLFEDAVKAGKVPSEKTTFQDFSTRWIEEYSKPHHKTKTSDSYASMLKRINPALGHIQIGKLSPIQINEFLLNLKEEGVKLTDKNHCSGLSDKSVKNYYTLISSILSTAKKWKIISENPIEGLDPPKVTKRQVKSLEEEDVLRLFLLLEDEPLQYHIFIKLAVLSGMRRGELVGLKWKNIDFSRCLVHVTSALLYTPDEGIFEDSTKTEDSVRTIKISAHMFELLALHKQQQDERKTALAEKWIDKDFVFTQWNGEPMHPNTPYTWFTRFQKRYGLPHCSIQMLRHTSATLLIMSGANVKMVSGRLGHSNTSTTTNIYTSYLKSADEMASDALDAVLGFADSDSKND